MMMMPRLQKWGSFFLPRKQNLSLSFSRAQNTQPRVCEKNFFIPRREWRPLSSSSSSKERVWESTSFIITLFCKNTLFFSLSVCLEKWSFLSVLFRPLFSFFLFRREFSFWKLFFSTSFDWMNAFFKTRGRKSRSTPNTLFSLWLFLWENALLSIRFNSSTQ